LQTLLKDIQGREDEVILFFDEIDALFSHSPKGALALPQQFRLLLDNPKIHCIGAITEHNYPKTIGSDPALARRFRPMNIAEMSDKDTLLALRDFMIHQHPDISIPDEALETALSLYEDDETVARLARTKKLLIEAANTLRVYRGKESGELQKAQEEYNRARKELHHSGRIDMMDSGKLAMLRDLEATMDQLQEATDYNERLIKERAILATSQKEWQQRLCNSAHDVADKTDETAKKYFFFLHQFMQETVAHRLMVQETRMKARALPTQVDSSLITNLYSSGIAQRVDESQACEKEEKDNAHS
jgi:ATP-dependent Clp protease ATP-binding subunit ClpA